MSELQGTTIQAISVSPEEGARLLGIGRSLFFELMRSGEISSLKIGKRRIVPVAELHAFISRLAAEQNPTNTKE